jgi:hypothetical protein
LQRMATVVRRPVRRNRRQRSRVGKWRQILVLTLAVTLFVPGVLRAAIYAFVDERGVKHFTNVPDDPRYRLIVPTSRGPVRISINRNEDHINRYEDHIGKAARRYRLDPLLIRAVVREESNFDPQAVSSKGAMGLMQLMPETAQDMGVANPYDPEANILGGTRYLRVNLDRFKGNLRLTLAAYNAGPERVEQAGGIPAIPETIDYVQKVLARYRQYLQSTSTLSASRGRYAAD